MTHAVVQVAYSRTARAMIEFAIRHMSRGVAGERRRLDPPRQQPDESNYSRCLLRSPYFIWRAAWSSICRRINQHPLMADTQAEANGALTWQSVECTLTRYAGGTPRQTTDEDDRPSCKIAKLMGPTWFIPRPSSSIHQAILPRGSFKNYVRWSVFPIL